MMTVGNSHQKIVSKNLKTMSFHVYVYAYGFSPLFQRINLSTFRVIAFFFLSFTFLLSFFSIKTHILIKFRYYCHFKLKKSVSVGFFVHFIEC